MEDFGVEDEEEDEDEVQNVQIVFARHRRQSVLNGSIYIWDGR